MAWLEKRRQTYYVAYRDERGKIKRIRAYTDRQASRQMLARYEKSRARGAEGLVDPFQEHRSRPFAEHAADYVAELRTVGRDDMYVYNLDKRLTLLAEACKWKVLGDVSADSFCRWRETIPAGKDGKPKLGASTQNQCLEAVRTFLNWCIKRKRLESNALVDVGKVDETADVRRARRAFSEEEIGRLLAVMPAAQSLAYRFILATGLRRQELADLRWGDLHLDSPMPFIQLRAAATKSRRADCLPLRLDLAAELREGRGDAEDSASVFLALPSIEEHREYLTTAGIPWTDSEGRRADLHSLRHTYGTLLSKAGVSPRVAMELMRHSDMRLTMKVYTDPRLFDLAGAVEQLPTHAVPAAKPATGTDGKAGT